MFEPVRWKESIKSLQRCSATGPTLPNSATEISCGSNGPDIIDSSTSFADLVVTGLRGFVKSMTTEVSPRVSLDFTGVCTAEVNISAKAEALCWVGDVLYCAMSRVAKDDKECKCTDS